jgi:hypothetical protein
VDIGDPGAPIGSPPWCRAAHLQLCSIKRQADTKVRHLKYDLLAFKKEESWRQLTHGKGKHFRSWEEYVVTPEPDGLGIPLESVQAILDIAHDGALIGERMRDDDEIALLRMEVERLETELLKARTILGVLRLENECLQRQRSADVKRLARIDKDQRSQWESRNAALLVNHFLLIFSGPLDGFTRLGGPYNPTQDP